MVFLFVGINEYRGDDKGVILLELIHAHRLECGTTRPCSEIELQQANTHLAYCEPFDDLPVDVDSSRESVCITTAAMICKLSCMLLCLPCVFCQIIAATADMLDDDGPHIIATPATPATTVTPVSSEGSDEVGQFFPMRI